MKNWDHNIHQHVQKFECTKLELFCFIFVEVIKKFIGSGFFLGGSPCFRFRLVCSVPCIIFSRLCTKWFPSFSLSIKYSAWQKMFSKRSGKIFLENFLNLKSTVFHSRWINKQDYKWEQFIKKMTNIQVIEINSLLNYLWKNHNLLKKKEDYLWLNPIETCNVRDFLTFKHK